MSPDMLPGIDVSVLPPRSLALRGPVWGVDPSTLRQSVGILVPGGSGALVRWETCSLPPKAHSHSPAGWYSACFRAMHPFFTRLVEEHGVPRLVWVEEPFAAGKQHVHPSSNRMLGVLLATLGFTLPSLAAELELVQPNTWKMLAMGQGRGLSSPAQYLEWAQQVAGYTGTLEDEAAGIGIATGCAVRASS